MKTIHPSWIDWPETAALIRAFADAGEELRFVGGCVRDTLTGREVKDIDAATPATPEQVMALLASARIRVIPTGITHGTVTAVIQGKAFEITTLRKDADCDGRHADVTFTDDWKEDAARRDFTVNALYLSPDGTMYDYFDGIADVLPSPGRKRAYIRFIGDPRRRIREDYLRILRFFRFLATHGDPPADEEALSACGELAAHMEALSGERIQAEMLKLLGAVDPVYALERMQRTGVLRAVFGSPIAPESVKRLIHLERQCHQTPHALLRLALLVRTAPDPAAMAKGVAERWRLSRKDEAALLVLSTHARVPEDNHFASLKRVIRRIGNAQAAALLFRDGAENGTILQGEGFGKALRLAQDWAAPSFPVTGHDLLALGYREGQELGNALQRIETYWEENQYAPTKEMLIRDAALLLPSRPPE